MCVLFSPATFIWDISHYKKKWARYDHECTLAFLYSKSYSCQILIELEFSKQIFEKYPYIKFN